MVRRRILIALSALLGAGALAMVPAAGSAGGSNNGSGNSEGQGNGPKELRCDPMPGVGNGPPAGKGQKCASP